MDTEKRNIRSFNIDDQLYQWLCKWKEQSGLSMSEILNMLILEKVPSSMAFTGIHWEFIPWKTTADILPDE